MSLLLIIFNCINIFFVIIKLVGYVVIELVLVGSMASIEKVAFGFLKVKLSFFKKILVLEILFSLLTWGTNHEQQFPNFAYFA
jgi:hypothetical protein